MALAPGEARKDLSADALFQALRSRFASLPDPRSGEVEIPLGDAVDVGFRDALAQRPIPAGLRRPPPRPQRQLSLHLWDQPRTPPTPRCGHSRSCQSRGPAGPVPRDLPSTCNAAGRSKASSIWTVATCCRWTARPTSPPPRSIAPRVWRSTIATATSPIPINCWVPLWFHPDLKEVIPLAPEPIIQQDGQTKNDCERNATRRWLKRFRQEHPHLPVIVVEDAPQRQRPPPPRPA